MYFKMDKLFFEYADIPLSMKPDMTYDQLHEIFINKFKTIIKSPYKTIKPGQRCAGGILIEVGKGVYIEVDGGTDIRWKNLLRVHYADNKMEEFYFACDDDFRHFIYEAASKKEGLRAYALMDHFCPGSSGNIKFEMNKEQTQQVIVKKLKAALELPEVALEKTSSSIKLYKREIHTIHDQPYTRDIIFAEININQNSKGYGACFNYRGMLAFIDKPFADYVLNEYDRLSKIERIPKIKMPEPEPEPKPQKTKGVLEKLWALFKGISKS